MTIVIRGDGGRSGVYLLAIRVCRPLRLAFGRYQGGRLIDVPAGLYLYVGSARGRTGASALGGRILRHATRSAGQPPHLIRNDLATRMVESGLVEKLQMPVAKRLRWHIDYLLDDPAADLAGVFMLCTPADLESALVARLATRPDIVPLGKGLGASDKPGQTHLLRLVTRG